MYDCSIVYYTTVTNIRGTNVVVVVAVRLLGVDALGVGHV